MIYNSLGKTGLRVSSIGMGCSGIGKNMNNRNNDESFRTLLEAYESGINFFDTAPNYNNGESEKLIGKTFKAKRDHIIISSKVGIMFSTAGKFLKIIKPYLYPVKDIIFKKNNLSNLYRSQRRNNFTKEFIIKTVEESLKRLQTDYLDLLLLHHPTNEILCSGDFLETFELLKSQGKVRYYGVSCDSVEHGLLSSKLDGISFIQIELNMITHTVISDLLPITIKNNIGVVARLPLAKGLLTNSNSNTKAEKWAYDRKVFEERKRKAEQLKFLINEKRSMVQAAMKFLLQVEGVSVTLPGFSSRKHLREIMNSLYNDLLNQEELKKIYNSDSANEFE